MFKYMKWELLDEVRKKKYIFAFIAVVYLLTVILPEDSTLLKYLIIPLSIILIGSLVLAYISGSKRTMETYQNKTFLLESMIPLSPNKILLAKYLLAIISNITYCIIFVLGLSAVLAKADINLIKEIVKFFFSLELDEWSMLLRIFLFMTSMTIATTAFTVLVFLVYKSLFPNMKGIKIISYITSVFIMNIVTTNFLRSIIEAISESDIADIYISLIFLAISTVCYFASLWFVKNKLEIYN